MERGTFYAGVQTELFNFIEDYVDRDPDTIAGENAEALVAHFENWFVNNASPRRVFVPCVISRTPAPRFEIGPVTFEFIDRVVTSSFCPARGGDTVLDQSGLNDLVRWMRE